ncbi:MAG: DUF2100 domain-containing protein [Candidatus Hermodarchaeota archaeon]
MSNNLTSSEVKIILSALEDLLEIKVLFRKIAPNYIFDDLSKEKYLSILSTLYDKIQPIFQKFLTEKDSEESIILNEIEFLEQLKKEDNITMVSASSSKKILKKMGFNPLNIIVSGGPLLDEDYKKINPNLSAQSLLGIKKKCLNILKILQSQKIHEKPLIFIFEVQNLTDTIILNELGSIIDLIGKEIETYKISSWTELEKYLTV